MVKSKDNSLVMKLIQVLHVPKNDVFLVDNARRNLLNAAGHFPQISLQKHQRIVIT